MAIWLEFFCEPVSQPHAIFFQIPRQLAIRRVHLLLGMVGQKGEPPVDVEKESPRDPDQSAQVKKLTAEKRRQLFPAEVLRFFAMQFRSSASGDTMEQFLKRFPGVTRVQAGAGMLVWGPEGPRKPVRRHENKGK